ncbi:MAG: helix-turn-helix domain-containing protein [Nitrospira sp.]|nr:helix-turn-helix domain-containing protein [Nitrospira sp.]
MTKQVGCPTEITLDVIAGRWKVMVIFWLLQDNRRFNQLQRDLSGITHRTLAKQLKEMEADGLVEREDFGEIPPRVEYRLTPLGRSLEPVLAAMHDWAIQHGAKIRSSSKG